MTTSEALFEYFLRLGDSNLVLGHRLSELCGHGPILEEDIATTNIALDLLGQARSLLTFAGEVEGKGRTEDDLAYLRPVREYRNLQLVELPNGDFADTTVRQFLFDVFNYYVNVGLKSSSDERLRSVAEKSIKEITYHVRHSSEWVIRMGDGTEESHERAQRALNSLWPYTTRMFVEDEVDRTLFEAGIGVNLKAIKAAWLEKVKEVFAEATLTIPADSPAVGGGGKQGMHTEHLGYVLADLQYMQRAYPGAEW